ncbi:hypothetical protein [Mycolicibacter terrae]|nr:hypothetical protein [Mycolicibacter terrae]
MNFTELPLHWQKEIKDLRRECTKARAERNEARKALAELASAVAGKI